MVKKSILCFPFVTCAGYFQRALNSDDKGTYADNGCYKLHQEVRNFQQGWEEVVQEVDEESLYV